MEKYIDRIEVVLKIIRTRFYALDGLAVTILAANFLYYELSQKLGGFDRLVKYVYPNTPENYLDIANLGAHFLVSIVVTCVWILKRRTPRFATDKAGILFASTNPAELENQVAELQARVREEVKQRDLLNLIEICTLPRNIVISDPQFAGSLILKAKATLLVWGHFETSELRGRKVTGFPKINFTHAHPSNVSPEYHQQVTSSLVGRQWAYQNSNEFVEKSLVVQNIAQVALNIVGLTLLVKSHFDQAEAIFGILDVELEQWRLNQNTPPHVVSFCANVRTNRVKAIALQVKREYLGIFKSQGIFHATQEELSKWDAKITSAILLDKRDSGLFVMKCILSFLVGNIGAARKAILQAKNCAPKADPSPDFCEAFIYFFNGEFRKARACYKISLAKKGSHNQAMVVEIIEFIQQVLDRYPEKFQFHYALGVLNEHRLDSARALEEYELFCERAKGDTYYSGFLKDVERSIIRLKSVLKLSA